MLEQEDGVWSDWSEEGEITWMLSVRKKVIAILYTDDIFEEIKKAMIVTAMDRTQSYTMIVPAVKRT